MLDGDDDEIEYKNFLHGMFNNNLEDDNNEEEYKPAVAEENDDFDDEISEDDSLQGFTKVGMNEVHDLVNGCWKAVLMPPEVEMENTSLSPNEVKVDPNHIAKQIISSAWDVDDSFENDALSVTSFGTEDNFTKFNPLPGRSHLKSSRADLAADGVMKRRGFNRDNRMMSKIIQQMRTADTKPEDLSLDGYPVNAYRSIILRQLSMMSQLLIQLFLLSTPGSPQQLQCRQIFESLIKGRSSSMKRAALMRTNIANLIAFKKLSNGSAAHATAQPTGHPPLSSPSPSSSHRHNNHNSGNVEFSNSLHGSAGLLNVEDLNSRFSFIASDNSNGSLDTGVAVLLSQPTEDTQLIAVPGVCGASENTWKSMLDLPVLNERAAFMELMTAASDKIHTAVATTDPCQRHWETLAAVNEMTSRLIASSRGRYWTCLAPCQDFPLRKFFVDTCLNQKRVAPLSDTQLYSRMNGTDSSNTAQQHDQCMYTPAEEDLLLKGVVAHGCDWEFISRHYLPHKSPHSLMVHYCQSIAITTPGRNVFKDYLKADQEARHRDSHWTHEEDLQLLKGYHTFGDKWYLIALHFLPHRKKKDLKQRWSMLSKQGQKTRDDSRQQQLEHRRSNGSTLSSSSSSSSSAHAPMMTEFDQMSDRAKIFLHYLFTAQCRDAHARTESKEANNAQLQSNPPTTQDESAGKIYGGGRNPSLLLSSDHIFDEQRDEEVLDDSDSECENPQDIPVNSTAAIKYSDSTNAKALEVSARAYPTVTGSAKNGSKLNVKASNNSSVVRAFNRGSMQPVKIQSSTFNFNTGLEPYICLAGPLESSAYTSILNPFVVASNLTEPFTSLNTSVEYFSPYNDTLKENCSISQALPPLPVPLPSLPSLNLSMEGRNPVPLQNFYNLPIKRIKTTHHHPHANRQPIPTSFSVQHPRYQSALIDADQVGSIAIPAQVNAPVKKTGKASKFAEVSGNVASDDDGSSVLPVTVSSTGKEPKKQTQKVVPKTEISTERENGLTHASKAAGRKKKKAHFTAEPSNIVLDDQVYHDPSSFQFFPPSENAQSSVAAFDASFLDSNPDNSLSFLSFPRQFEDDHAFFGNA